MTTDDTTDPTWLDEAARLGGAAFRRAYQDAVIATPKGDRGITREAAQGCYEAGIRAAMLAALPAINEGHAKAQRRHVLEQDSRGETKRCSCGALFGVQHPESDLRDHTGLGAARVLELAGRLDTQPEHRDMARRIRQALVPEEES